MTRAEGRRPTTEPPRCPQYLIITAHSINYYYPEFFLKDFIYLFERVQEHEQERERESEQGEEQWEKQGPESKTNTRKTICEVTQK